MGMWDKELPPGAPPGYYFVPAECFHPNICPREILYKGYINLTYYIVVSDDPYYEALFRDRETETAIIGVIHIEEGCEQFATKISADAEFYTYLDSARKAKGLRTPPRQAHWY
jgi:hypothetical protein